MSINKDKKLFNDIEEYIMKNYISKDEIRKILDRLDEEDSNYCLLNLNSDLRRLLWSEEEE